MSESPDVQRMALDAIRGSIEYHKANPHVSIENHTRARQIELAKQIEGRRAIYLDLRFWIGLRGALIAEITGPYAQLLLELRRAVAAGAVFCPISESTFLEVFKQTDPNTRLQTVRLIDELSLGVTLTPMDLRIGTEIAHLMHAARRPEGVHPLHHLVWSKLSYVLGFVHPTTTAFDASTALAIQKAFFDHMWTIPMVEMNRLLGDGLSRSKLDREESARRINEGNRQHSKEVKSFAQTYQNELVGLLDLYAGRAAEILCSMAPASVGPPPAKGSEEWRAIERQCLALLVGAFKTDQGKNGMRTLHIQTCLHAAVRWNKKQQLEGNDFFDFEHACAALGYCDAFFTERGLRALVTRSDLQLDKRFGCQVIDKVEDAIAYIGSAT